MNVKLSCQSKSHKQACSFSLVKLQSFRRSVSSLALSWSPPACGFPALNSEVLHQGAGFSGYPWLRSVDWSDHRLPILPPPLSCHYQPRALLLGQAFKKWQIFYVKIGGNLELEAEKFWGNTWETKNIEKMDEKRVKADRCKLAVSPVTRTAPDSHPNLDIFTTHLLPY